MCLTIADLDEFRAKMLAEQQRMLAESQNIIAELRTRHSELLTYLREWNVEMTRAVDETMGAMIEREIARESEIAGRLEHTKPQPKLISLNS